MKHWESPLDMLLVENAKSWFKRKTKSAKRVQVQSRCSAFHEDESGNVAVFGEMTVTTQQ